MSGLAQLLDVLETLAPLRLAGSWDNVGLLLEGTRPIRRLGLAIDLTEPVVDELIEAEVDAIISYHPPIFGGLKRITAAEPRSRSLLALIRSGVHVYSPHSALDAAAGGMADWLLDGLGRHGEPLPLEPDVVDPSLGAGRVASLDRPVPLQSLLEPLAVHLGISSLRVSGSMDRVVDRVAVCPGAGGSVFENTWDVDLLLTGEMRHHDVLARAEAGIAVILTDHTNTERGYLPVFAERLREATGLEVVVSARDSDPLVVVSL